MHRLVGLRVQGIADNHSRFYQEVDCYKVYVVNQKCTIWPPIKFGVLVRIINKKLYLHNDNKKEFFSKS